MTFFYLPAMVAAVSSSSSLSFSSFRFSSSLWCFFCSSSITFWWDSSMAAKPLSQVACGKKRAHCSCEFAGHLSVGPKGSPDQELSRRKNLLDLYIIYMPVKIINLVTANHLQAWACQPWASWACVSTKRIKRNDRIHNALKKRAKTMRKEM